MSCNLKEYMGENILLKLKDERKKRCVRANIEGMRANYHDTVDAQLCDEQILLCDCSQ